MYFDGCVRMLARRDDTRAALSKDRELNIDASGIPTNTRKPKSCVQ
jgi:hypothetical protein